MHTRTLALAALILAACYNPNIQPGQQACSMDGKCPDGLACAANKRCYPIGFNPDCASKCAAPTPICDKSTLTCVACLDDSTCPAGFVCALAQKVCKPGCSKSHPGCAADAGACDVDMGACHGCLDDKACGNGTPRCDVMSGVCFECLPANDNCPDGQYCDVHTCKPGCKDVASCAGPDGGGGSTECCAHTCADLQSDANNCGRCGNACAQGSVCCAGACTDPATDVANCGGCGKVCKPANVTAAVCTAGACGYAACNPSFTDCDKVTANGCEVNTGADSMNCGVCGMACKTPPNGKAVCTMGACTLAGCSMGFADCDVNLANGCEVNTTSDVKNCAGCGMACPNVANGVPACKASVCGVASCNLGFGDCDAAPGNGCEINTTTNPAHCGGCGRPCMLANAIPGCVGSLCSVASCNAGFGNCDGMAANGCEVNTNTDISHCGGCGRLCAPANATPSCKAGVCGIGVCSAGFTDCDMMAANGCEKNTATDVNNCGVCGKVCAFANAGATCVAGVCTLGACTPGFGNCDNNPANGCEVNLTNDPANCRACAAKCGLGQTCTNSACVSAAVLLGTLVNTKFYKVPIAGAMTDTNLFNTCKAIGMNVGCQAAGMCMYNDMACVMTPEASCGNPMSSLATALCMTGPGQCPALNGVFTYMGHTWNNDSSCGALNGVWCSVGNMQMNQFGLCVL